MDEDKYLTQISKFYVYSNILYDISLRGFPPFPEIFFFITSMINLNLLYLSNYTDRNYVRIRYSKI